MPTLVTLAGTMTFFRLVLFWNILSGISVMVEGRVNSVVSLPWGQM